MASDAAEVTFGGVVLVRADGAAAATAQRLLSWYDAATPLAPRLSAAGQTELYNPDAKFASARLQAEHQQWSVRALAGFAATHCTVIVTPDGEWHARKGSETPAEWHERLTELLADHYHFAALVYEFRSVLD